MFGFRFTNEANEIVSLVKLWSWNSQIPQIPADNFIIGHVNSYAVTFSPLAMNTESQRKRYLQRKIMKQTGWE